MPRTAGVCLLALTAFGYCSWVLEFFLPTGLPAAQSYVAELSAEAGPYSQVFRALEFATGAAALFSTPFLARLLPAQRMPRLTVMAIAVFGVIMLLRGTLVLDCAPSASQLCLRRQDSGALSPANQTRWVLAVATVVVFWLGAASAERWFSRGFWRNGIRFALGATVASAVVIVVLGMLGPGHYVGVAVRVEMTIQAVTLFFGAIYLLNTARWPQRRRAHPASQAE